MEHYPWSLQPPATPESFSTHVSLVQTDNSHVNRMTIFTLLQMPSTHSFWESAQHFSWNIFWHARLYTTTCCWRRHKRSFSFHSSFFPISFSFLFTTPKWHNHRHEDLETKTNGFCLCLLKYEKRTHQPLIFVEKFVMLWYVLCRTIRTQMQTCLSSRISPAHRVDRLQTSPPHWKRQLTWKAECECDWGCVRGGGVNWTT